MVCFTMRIVQWIPILLIIIYDITVCVGSGYTQIDCGPEKFRCDNGECIANELLCNGRADCTDSSDETEDECKKSDILCPTSTFRCNYGACINEDYRCNGIQDCIDNSDETYCNRNNKTDQKINFTRRCKHDEYGCSDGQCIHINDKCDGIPNCGDGSDETFTLCGSLFCPPTAFRCAYGACIDGNLRCDGVANCADSSDEDLKLCDWPSYSPPIRSSTETTRSPLIRRAVTPRINTCTAPPQPENGHWMLELAQCISDAKRCNIPEGTALLIGTYLVYSCYSGYEINGTTSIICSTQGKWKPAIPICIAETGNTTQSPPTGSFETPSINTSINTCTVPPQPENGHWMLYGCLNEQDCNVLEGTKVELGYYLIYSCNSGYNLNGTTVVTCSFQGKWQPAIPICTETTQSIRPSIRPSETSNRNTCTTPPQPENGHWKLRGSQCLDEQDCNVPEGMAVELGTNLIYTCNSGYKLSDSTIITCSFPGKWQPTIPICTEVRCKALDTASIRAKCKHKNQWISCKSSVPPETNAILTCENSYRPATNLNLLLQQRDNVICNENGQWEPEPMRCIPVCGILPFAVKPNIVGGFHANITEFPWHATLYLDEVIKKKFICGASIIQENLLITAAHCVYDDNIRQLRKPSRIYVLTGNMFRDYDNPIHNPNFIQRNQVKHIYIHSGYVGLDGNFLRDIAILELVTPFVFSATLVPVCIDTENDRRILEPDSFGKVAGFGRTEFNESSAVLQALTVPAITFNRCWSVTNTNMQRFYTNDKFCAGYINGSSVCDGDSGGGLVFKTFDLWYLRGIVSVSLGAKEEGGAIYCNNNVYTLYTDVFKYVSWIQTIIRSIEHNQTRILCSESETRCS